MCSMSAFSSHTSLTQFQDVDNLHLLRSKPTADKNGWFITFSIPESNAIGWNTWSPGKDLLLTTILGNLPKVLPMPKPRLTNSISRIQHAHRPSLYDSPSRFGRSELDRREGPSVMNRLCGFLPGAMNCCHEYVSQLVP